LRLFHPDFNILYKNIRLIITMKLELHCHSWYSKGSKIPWEGLASPRDMVKDLKKKGFGGVAITDHNTIGGWKDAKAEAKRQGLVFIPGVEISTASGHLIALGVEKCTKAGLSLEETNDLVHRQGGITVAPHPFDLRGEGIGREFRKADAAEIFNSLNLTRIENGIAKKEISKVGMPAVGGSDAHSLEMLGMTSNIIEAHDADSVISQIMKGRIKVEGRYTSIPLVVSWVRERMKRSYDEVEMYTDKNYSAPKAALSRFMLRRFVGSTSRGWDMLGYFIIGLSTAYSTLRLAKR